MNHQDKKLAKEVYLSAKLEQWATCRDLISQIKDPSIREQAQENYDVLLSMERNIKTFPLAGPNTPIRIVSSPESSA